MYETIFIVFHTMINVRFDENEKKTLSLSNNTFALSNVAAKNKIYGFICVFAHIFHVKIMTNSVKSENKSW